MNVKFRGLKIYLWYFKMYLNVHKQLLLNRSTELLWSAHPQFQKKHNMAAGLWSSMRHAPVIQGMKNESGNESELLRPFESSHSKKAT